MKKILNDNQIERIVKFLVKNESVISRINLSNPSIMTFQKIAYGLGFIEGEPYYILHNHILTAGDLVQIIDKIWEYCVSGVFGPGDNVNSKWFPYFHVTKKGQDFKSNIEEEEVRLVNNISFM